MLPEALLPHCAPQQCPLKVSVNGGITMAQHSERKCIAKCFVAMPFGEPFDTIYNECVGPAVKSACLAPSRGDSRFRPAPIVDDICRMIQDAVILVADLTTGNQNVLYEIGLAHAIGKPVVLVAEQLTDIPFDLQSLRVLIYDKNDPFWGMKLRSKLTRAIRETLENPIESLPPMLRKLADSEALVMR
ncbi:MAG: hypothetical protein AB1512_11995 [Thermodesulfobacteriota bacterium]